MNKKGKIVIMGLGYIGLPTATMFAISGYKVVGVDLQSAVVETINRGKIHIEEPGLAEMVKGAIQEKNLKAALEPEKADAFIIAVPTPLTDEKRANLEYVRNAAHEITPYLEKGNLVIVESTISPRTTLDIVVPELEKSGLAAGSEFFVAHCPERVLPGNIIYELAHNNRVIGGINEESALKARKLYKSFVKGEMHLTDVTTAEITKLMENTYRDVNIALANELAQIAKDVNVDILEAIKLANKHPRVNIHQPGPGVGGHCIAIDPWFIVESSPENAELIKLARNINDNMPAFVVENLLKLLPDIYNPKVSIFGITYKGNVDDLRESPVLEIIELLEQQGINLALHDPHVKKSYLNLKSIKEAVRYSDCIVIGADHDEFKDLNPARIKNLMRSNIIYDTKDIIDKNRWEKAGFTVYKLGDYSYFDWYKKYGTGEIKKAYNEAAASE